MDAFEIVSAMFENTPVADVVTPVFFCALLILGALWISKKRAYTRWQAGNLALLALLVGLVLTNTVSLGACSLYVAVFVVLIAQAVMFLAVFLFNKRKLDCAAKWTDGHGGECDFVKAHRVLSSVGERLLTKGQIQLKKEYLVLVVFKLGNPDKAERLLGGMALEPAFMHFMLHNIRFLQGRLDESDEELKRADAAVSGDTSPIVKAQVSLNKGVLMVFSGSYMQADIQFAAAKKVFEEEAIKSKDLLNCLYENYALNKTRLGYPDGGRKALKEALSGYEDKLDLTQVGDRLALFNLKMLALRQLESSPQEMNDLSARLVNDEEFLKQLDEKQRLVFYGSSAGVAAFGSLDPTLALTYLNANIGDSIGLTPAQRLSLFSQVSEVLSRLNIEYVQRFPQLVDSIRGYYLADAESDLDVRLKELPEDAISERCALARESIQHAAMAMSDDRFEEVALRNLREAAELAKGAGNIIEEANSRLLLLDMLLEAPREDAGLRNAALKEAESNVCRMEGLLSGLMLHPYTAHIHLQLSWHCAILADEDAFLRHYLAYQEMGVPVEQFSWREKPLLARVLFVAKAYAFKRSLDVLAKNADLLSPKARRWAQQLPEHEGYDEVLLLGKLFGLPRFLMSVRNAPDPSDPKGFKRHCWLPLPPVLAAFDPTFPNVADEADQLPAIVFPQGAHPLELGLSQREAVARAITGEQLPMAQMELFTSEIVEGGESFYSELYTAVLGCEPPWAPSTQELQCLFNEIVSITPFPVGAEVEAAG